MSIHETVKLITVSYQSSVLRLSGYHSFFQKLVSASRVAVVRGRHSKVPCQLYRLPLKKASCREHHVEYGALERRGGSSTRRSEANPAATHVCFAGQLINKAALRAQPSGESALQPLIRIIAATDQQVSTTPITTGLLVAELRV